QIGQELTNHIAEWQQLLSTSVEIPLVDVYLKPEEFTTSYFVPARFEIHLGTLTDGQFSPARTTNAVFAHEYAHSVFTENFTFQWKGEEFSLKKLAKDSESDRNKLARSPRLQEMFEAIQEIQKTLEIARSVNATSTVKNLESLLEARKRELSEQLPSLARFNFIHELTIAHNELFADSLPALFWKDHRIMTDVLETSHRSYIQLLKEELLQRGKNPEATSMPRDFAITSFKNWQQELVPTYTLLDPARGALWSLYMNNLRTEDFGLFFKVFLSAASRQVTLQLERQGEQVDAAELNREFLKIFVEEARANKLPIRKKP
ncbi:hypothetical protein K2X05_00035, partial [bacterium]|nr:hypothetical protein [bacterium]